MTDQFSASDTSSIIVQGSSTSKKDIKVRELWVGNLPEKITEERLYQYFFIHGEIESIELHLTKKNNFAFIRFMLTGCAKRAWDQFNGYNLEGR
jgi:RNA recognition motif-containing protein